MQNRVSGSCSSGSAIGSVNQDGSVTCQDTGSSTAFAVGSPEGVGVLLAVAPDLTSEGLRDLVRTPVGERLYRLCRNEAERGRLHYWRSVSMFVLVIGGACW